MKYENILKNLRKDGYKLTDMEFDNKPVVGVNGTALIDLVGYDVVPTESRYNDVIEAITEGLSHVYTINGKVKTLSQYKKA